jgi:hypothetical protein
MPQTVPVRVVPRGLPPRWRWRAALLVSLAWSVGMILEAPAATTWTVCASGCDYTSIKHAIAESTTLDGDTLAIAAGTYTEPGITVNKRLTLQGESAATTIVQAATSRDTAPDRVFTIPSGVTVTLQDLTIRHGQAAGWPGGGGLLNWGTLTLAHSTVRDNNATYGGGLYNAGTLTLTHSTLRGNTAEYGGGGFYHTYGTLILTHSLVANNSDGKDCLLPGAGAITSHGYNLDSDRSCELTAPTDLPGTDPLLGPLQDNGGPTVTHTLLPGSPAMDAIPWGVNGCGTTVYSDQRGQARPEAVGGACDIGASEVAGAGQALGGWVSGFTPHASVCTNVTTGHEVPLSDPDSAWDCEAAGLDVAAGDRVTLLVRGRVKKGATDVDGAMAGMVPTSGGCANLTTGQQVPFQHLVGATAASCVATGLVVQPGHHVQMGVQGTAE